VAEPAHHCTYTASGTAARKVSLPTATPDYKATYRATITTNRGDIVIDLLNSKATCTVNSFIHLAEAGPGAIDSGIELLGEVHPNGDRLAHITPRFPGIVRAVRRSAGDAVRAGAAVVLLAAFAVIVLAAADAGSATARIATPMIEAAHAKRCTPPISCIVSNLTRAPDAPDARPSTERWRRCRARGRPENKAFSSGSAWASGQSISRTRSFRAARLR